jgi:hypothetical protein
MEVVAGEEGPSSTLLLMDTIEDEVGALLLAATIEEWAGMTNASDRDAPIRREMAARRRRRTGLGVAMMAARRTIVLSWKMKREGCGGDQRSLCLRDGCAGADRDRLM